MSHSELGTRRALLFGHEESLLSSRKWLLRTIGCDCHVVNTLPAYRAALLSGEFHLIILCQTASGDECAAISEFAGEHSAETPLLIMFGRHDRCKPDQEFVLLDAMAGPDVFVKTAGRMLAHADVMAAGLQTKHPFSAAPI